MMTNESLAKFVYEIKMMYGIEFLRAYLKCSPGIKIAIGEMLETLDDPETDDDDYESVLLTLSDTLFPPLPKTKD
jgi:hypothetical protein